MKIIYFILVNYKSYIIGLIQHIKTTLTSTIKI